jgi:hypothetical protein
VKVRCSEGLAIHTDPKPCAGVREDVGEASAGESIGQPSSRESDFAQGADAVSYAEGNTIGHVSASAQSTLRGLRPWHVRTLPAREPGDLQLDHWHGGPHREGEEP